MALTKPLGPRRGDAARQSEGIEIKKSVNLASREPSCENRELELTGAQFEEIAGLAITSLSTFLDETEKRKAFRDDADESKASTPERLDADVVGGTALPDSGESVEDLFPQLLHELTTSGVDTTNPRYFGYVPGGGLPHAAIADLIAGVVNRYIGVRNTAPACSRLDDTVIRWLCDIVGLGEWAGGFLTSGGSLANWSALTTALHQKVHSEFARRLIYASDQTHHSIKKAVKLAGLPQENVRLINSDEKQRICLDELSEQILADFKRGFDPRIVVGNAGTTNTGAVDNLEGLADIADHHKLWFHVDAAYGGFFALTDSGKQILKGMDRADSITLDPHKGLFLPYGTGSLLVKDVDNLKNVFQMKARYLRGEKGQSADLADVSLELTRPFRALRIWLPFKMHGIGPFRDNLDEKLRLARWLYEELRKLPFVEANIEPQLSTVTFRFCPPGADRRMLNAINESALSVINKKGRVFLTPTTLHNQFVLRVCILSFRTHREHVEQCLEEICEAASKLGMCSPPLAEPTGNCLGGATTPVSR